jgi:hypothetical protein
LPGVLATLLTLAATEGGHESSKTAFYVLGGILAGWAVLVAAVGILRHETFPPSAGGKAGVMAVTTLLVVATMASSILTA